MHTDACDVTLNVCLGKEFTGAGLTFCGLRGDATGNERRFSYRHKHVKGRAIIHLGHHRHGADDIVRCCALTCRLCGKLTASAFAPSRTTWQVTGERFNLIMWNKSSCFRLSREFMSKYSMAPSDRGTADIVCLSYTHDADYEDYQPYPPGKRPKPRQGG